MDMLCCPDAWTWTSHREFVNKGGWKFLGKAARPPEGPNRPPYTVWEKRGKRGASEVEFIHWHVDEKKEKTCDGVIRLSTVKDFTFCCAKCGVEFAVTYVKQYAKKKKSGNE